jgi:hypothetical protein
MGKEKRHALQTCRYSIFITGGRHRWARKTVQRVPGKTSKKVLLRDNGSGRHRFDLAYRNVAVITVHRCIMCII